jgi:hypothetical protein
MIELHGDNAIARAHLRAADLRWLGENDAAEIWVQVKVTIERLLGERRSHMVGAIWGLGVVAAGDH